MNWNQKYGYYPSTFNLDEFLQKYTLFKFKGYQVVRILSSLTFNYKKKSSLAKFSLNAEMMKNYAGNKYLKILELLIKEGVIEIVAKERIGVSSRKYRLTDLHTKNSEVIEYDCTSIIPQSLSSNIIKRVANKYQTQKKIPKNERQKSMPNHLLTKTYSYLINWLLSPELKFDNHYAYQLLMERFNLQNDIDSNRLSQKLLNKYRYGKISIKAFTKGNIFFYNDKNFRFYSNIISLPKYLRKAITFNGIKLVGFDISNTHPLLLCNLADSHFLEKLSLTKNIEVDPIKLNELKKLLSEKPNDFLKYKLDVESGEIYEKLNFYFPELSRKKVKSLFLTCLFKSEFKYLGEDVRKMQKIILTNYPTLALLLQTLKTVKHNYVANTLMAMEAQNLMINFINEFYYKEENCNIPIYTVHDCFLTLPQYKDIVLSELRKYFKETLDLNVSIKDVDYL